MTGLVGPQTVTSASTMTQTTPQPSWWEHIKLCHEHADRAEWLEKRATLAMTASEAAIVLQEPHGKHPPHMTREELAELKRGERVSDLDQNEEMWWGTEMEPVVLKRLREHRQSRHRQT